MTSSKSGAGRTPSSRVFNVPALDCASEEADIRRALEPVEGILSLNFQLSARTLGIAAEPATVDLAVQAIRTAGFKIEAIQVETGDPSASPAAGRAHDATAPYWRLGASLALAVVAELMAFFAPAGQPWSAIGMAVALVAIGLAGFDVYKKGLVALSQFKLNINALMSVAVTGAFLIGEWPEAAMVMALYAIAEMIEAKAVDRARNAIKGLMALAPEEALVGQTDGSFRVGLVKDVSLGAIVRIKPGERVPMDGTLTRWTRPERSQRASPRW